MIKARYSPATEDLVKQVLEVVPLQIHAENDNADFVAIATYIINRLREDLGYEISVEVQVHGDMAKALESLGGDTSNYVTRERPRRIHDKPTDHSMCGGGCPTD